MKELIYQFSDIGHQPSNNEVGGKGYSLIKMAKAGLAIPPGFVLSVAFFAPWLETLKSTQAWQQYAKSGYDPNNDNILEIKAHCSKLSFTEVQQTALDSALSLHPDIQLFAVRSSSPEEDLSGASFGGIYETVLGVTPHTLLNAIKTAFASCLDPRVFIYKKEQGFKTDDFSIAVVIMEQIASEVAGVGFSVDPITNDYDLAVFSSNWGLGETVVAGLASPDLFTVDKVKNEIIEKQVGAKEMSIWLLPDGGTEERPDPRQDDMTLSADQILALNHEIGEIEKLYGCPMDIEWAFANNRLYLLQARPITTYIPLPRGMETSPTDPRRLYLDITLCVQGLEKPLSAMGSDFIHHFLSNLMKVIMGTDKLLDINSGILYTVDGKMYLNLSKAFTLFDKKAIAEHLKKMDMISSQIISELKPTAYQDTKKLKLPKLRIFFRMYDFVFKCLTAKYRIKQLEKRYQSAVQKMELKIDKTLSLNTPLSTQIKHLQKDFAYFLAHEIIPAFVIGMRAGTKIKTLFSEEAKNNPEARLHLDNVSRSLPHNITIDMGLAIYELSSLLSKKDFSTQTDLIEAFHHKHLPTKFYDLWHQFMNQYGARGAEEFDIASTRYIDHPSMLLNQVFAMLDCEKEHSPQNIYNNSKKRREEAYCYLLGLAEQKGRRFVNQFKSNYALMVAFGGYRENHKFFLIKLIGKIRQRLLEKAEHWVKIKKLADKDQVFDLTLRDLSALEAGEIDNLQSCIEQNTIQIRRLEKVKRTPHIIDSRGKVLSPKKAPLKENEIGGQAISTGTVKGYVKVLHTPDEKPLLTNEILVARATDPGWTPLFVNASAIVLEVGGMLQHGALVAREYGKPCVAGVQHATQVLKDGDYIEIDGTTGIIRILESQNNGRHSLSN